MGAKVLAVLPEAVLLESKSRCILVDTSRKSSTNRISMATGVTNELEPWILSLLLCIADQRSHVSAEPSMIAPCSFLTA